MGRNGVEKRAIPCLHGVEHLRVSLSDLGFEHVEEFDSGKLEEVEDVRLCRECDLVRLNHHPRGRIAGAADKMILVADAAPFDRRPCLP
jgi:hypothetical protein